MTSSHYIRSSGRSIKVALLVAVCVGLAACVDPRVREYRHEVIDEPPPPPSTHVIFYPAQGQSPEQQSRDRYECYLWAARESGFDPSQAQLAPHQRIEVVPAEPAGNDTAAGAVTGAIFGAALSRPRQALGGALFGAVAGAMIGAASDDAREREAARLQRHYDAHDSQHSANVEAQASSYRRAMTACLEGRGYQVK